MKQARLYPALTITPKAEATVREGHPWVYGEEITKQPEELENGCLADVFNEKGSYLGTGIVSLVSKIRVRVLSSNANESFGAEFFERRIRYAVEYRKTVMGDDFSACRLIFGEADGIPGLTVDKYGDLLVTQILSYGIEQRKDMIFAAICKVLSEYGVKVGGIYERNDVAIRALEGLTEGKGWYEADFVPHPESAITEITENGVKYATDLENGQKTGFFLDQKYNRLAVAKIAKGKKVLDCFTHTGSFALNAALGGAEKVTAVDISASAIEMARKNAVRNGLEGKMDFIVADIFDLLPELYEKHADYDMIILDPPAFTKSRKTIRSAEGGYREINFRAMKLLPRGGYLATCSCSHFMESNLFMKMLKRAAADAGVGLKLVEARRQAPDHPVLLNVPETDYLKFYIFQLI